MGSQGGGGGGCSLCRLLNIMITLALLGGAGYVIWYFLGQPSGEDLKNTFGNIDFGDFSDVLQNFTGFGSDLWNKDPYVGDNTTNVWLGTTGVGGLTLELWNALDDSWQTEFAESFSDWDTCNPNALTLSTQRIEVDHACTHVTGVMKVCNGNHGETGWLGINEVTKIMPQNAIESSVAIMNEYYLNNAGYEERLYTMCHEIGHGFGLPHTDENFNNADLGNCLDYTTRPQNNLRPGEYNCNRLKTMYGSVDGSRRERFLRSVDEEPPYLSSGIGGSLTPSSPTDGTAYDQAMEDLRSYISSHRNERNRILHDVEVEAIVDDEIWIAAHGRKLQQCRFGKLFGLHHSSTIQPSTWRVQLQSIEDHVWICRGSRRERFLRNTGEDPAYLSSSVGGSLTSSSSTDGSVYDQAMEDLRSYISSRKNDKNRILHDVEVEAIVGEWRMIRNHPRGGAFVQKLKDDLVLEVHVIFPFN
ncbi:hypothetical protein IV203_018061 [Nitzschia inconspicua]|uniref:Uncharacterized protein n=1 Tax=Nitzschia inconspicua TaxID=303405 RepID=A0A9K3M1B1_9STRA|nr:hypothetical protein IV203_018061 [Nitzschia inconspicua]